MSDKYFNPHATEPEDNLSLSETELSSCEDLTSSTSEDATGSKEKGSYEDKLDTKTIKPIVASSSDSSISTASTSSSAVLPKVTAVPPAQTVSQRPGSSQSTSSKHAASPKRNRTDRHFQVFREIRKISKGRMRSKQIRRILRNFLVNYPLGTFMSSQTSSETSAAPGADLPFMSYLKTSKSDSSTSKPDKASTSKPDKASASTSKTSTSKPDQVSASTSKASTFKPDQASASSSKASSSTSEIPVESIKETEVSPQSQASDQFVSDRVNTLTDLLDDIESLEKFVAQQKMFDPNVPGPSSRFPTDDGESIMHRLASQILETLGKLRNLAEALRCWCLSDRVTVEELQYYMGLLNSMVTSSPDSVVVHQMLKTWEKDSGSVNQLEDATCLLQVENKLRILQQSLIAESHVMYYKYHADLTKEKKNTQKKD